MLKKDCIVVIPIYKDRLDEIEYSCLENYIKKLDESLFCFIAPIDLKDNYYNKKWEKIPIIKFDAWHADSLNEYNELLMTPDFYNEFLEYKYMLILQLDGWLIKGKEELEYFIGLGYDYIGAPWTNGGYRYYKRTVRGGNYVKLLRYFTGETVCKVGNGGVSLRRVERMEKFFKVYKKEKEEWKKAEDIFISFYGQKRKYRLKISPVKIAKQFSLEKDMEKEIMEGNIPMAVHKWKEYFPEMLLYFEENQRIKKE